jgi:ribosomal-protein-alanine N-acetyltransferase
VLTGKNENDIGYRIRQQYWQNGYGKEVANGLVKYAFNVLQIDEIVATADVRNAASLKILEQTMDLVDEYYNPDMDCTDRSYRIDKLGYVRRYL